MIGMIQPDPNGEAGTAVYRTGCANRITQFRKVSDCLIEMVLTGVCRFDIGQELPTTRGYRLILPDWSRFADDYLDPTELLQGSQEPLMKTLQHFFDIKGYEADLTMLGQLSAARLVDSLTMVLPFDTTEKQMLLETLNPEQRLANFIALIDGDFDVSDSVTRH